jgi:Protein of unknown function (DUF2997)
MTGSQPQQRVVLRVTPTGSITAETQGILGEECLAYIAALEYLLEADTVSSAFTADYTRQATSSTIEVSDELRQQ